MIFNLGKIFGDSICNNLPYGYKLDIFTILFDDWNELIIKYILIHFHSDLFIFIINKIICTF